MWSPELWRAACGVLRSGRSCVRREGPPSWRFARRLHLGLDRSNRRLRTIAMPIPHLRAHLDVQRPAAVRDVKRLDAASTEAPPHTHRPAARSNRSTRGLAGWRGSALTRDLHGRLFLRMCYVVSTTPNRHRWRSAAPRRCLGVMRQRRSLRRLIAGFVSALGTRSSAPYCSVSPLEPRLTVSSSNVSAGDGRELRSSRRATRAIRRILRCHE